MRKLIKISLIKLEVKILEIQVTLLIGFLLEEDSFLHEIAVRLAKKAQSVIDCMTENEDLLSQK